jgi:NADH-quinone oxidoreductase subunit L
VGKSAQFPLHTWLPDAMEGPTPVSALVHSATMVAAGVYLVARFFPFFTPEVLLIIAATGCITLFIAATIAVTATDIKRVLAYSTISQLGYMMLGLGLGGWLAGALHLITHAFFKSLLFLCSGSVIHAVHTNDMRQMGGLWRKMPYTAFTMLVGCLAIAGASIPFVVGLSGYYSKDAILEHAFLFMQTNRGAWGAIFFLVATGGAAITAFYMFRLWYMTFVGEPRDHHRYDHAHESPRSMYVPLVILAVLAVIVAWQPFQWDVLGPIKNLSLAGMLESARPAGTAPVDEHGGYLASEGLMATVAVPNEHAAHDPAAFWAIKFPVTMLAFGTAVVGIALATVIYWLRWLDAEEARKQFAFIYRFLMNKWWFDELYDWLFVRPVFLLSRVAAGIDRRIIDGLVDGIARVSVRAAEIWDRVADRTLVDGVVNLFASWTYSFGLGLRQVQTGKLRQYVLFIVVGAISVFILISFFWPLALGQ